MVVFDFKVKGLFCPVWIEGVENAQIKEGQNVKSGLKNVSKSIGYIPLKCHMGLPPYWTLFTIIICTRNQY